VIEDQLRWGVVAIGDAAKSEFPKMETDRIDAGQSPISGHPSEAFDFFFSRLSTDIKLGFFESWYRKQEDLPTDEGGAKSDNPVAGGYIGDGDSIVPELAGPPTPDPFGLPPKQAEPVTGTREPSQRLSPMVMAIGGAIALALILILVFTLLGGDDSPTPAEEAAGQAAEPEGAEQAGEPGTDEAEGIDFQTADGTAIYFGPTTVAAGESIEVTIEVRDANGDPVAGVPWYFTLDGPDDDVHFETVTDENGRARFSENHPWELVRRAR